MAGKLVIALDVGERRIGVAKGWTDVKIAQPLTTLTQTETILADLKFISAAEAAQAIVVGLPRNLNGDDTAQTGYARRFATDFQIYSQLPVYLQDEALTSRRAKAELAARKRPYDKAAVDALAATYILEDFFQALPKELHG